MARLLNGITPQFDCELVGPFQGGRRLENELPYCKFLEDNLPQAVVLEEARIILMQHSAPETEISWSAKGSKLVK